MSFLVGVAPAFAGPKPYPPGAVSTYRAGLGLARVCPSQADTYAHIAVAQQRQAAERLGKAFPW
jgi:hypothetical protein